MAKTNDKEFNIKDYKSEINEYIKERIDKEIEIKEYKITIDKYIKDRVEKEATSNNVKFYNKRLRNKSIIIFIETIIIIGLICAGLYSVYYLYEDGYFNNNNVIEVKKDDLPVVNDKPVEKVEPKTTLDDLVNKYANLLDNYNMDTKCDYLNEFYNGELTTELKEFFAFQLLDKEDITIDETSSFFDSNLLTKAYKSLFNEDINLSTFKYNGATYKYLETKEMFISSNVSTSGTKIIREITNIEEIDGRVLITTTEGYIKNDKLYNILTNKEVTDYKKDDKLSKHSKKLNVVTYTFNNNYLVSIK